MRYRVGDKVVVSSDVEQIKNCAHGFGYGMLDFVGMEVEISYTGENYYEFKDDSCLYSWDDNTIDHEATAKLHGKTTTRRDRAATIGALVDEKSAQYGDAIGAVDEVLRAYYPDGITPDQYKNLGLIVRISDKLMRLANGHTEDTMEDIFGYLLLMMEDE